MPVLRSLVRALTECRVVCPGCSPLVTLLRSAVRSSLGLPSRLIPLRSSPSGTYLRSATSSGTTPHLSECVTSEGTSSPVVGPLPLTPSLLRACSSNIECNRWFICLFRNLQNSPPDSTSTTYLAAPVRRQALFKAFCFIFLKSLPLSLTYLPALGCPWRPRACPLDPS